MLWLRSSLLACNCMWIKRELCHHNSLLFLFRSFSHEVRFRVTQPSDGMASRAACRPEREKRPSSNRPSASTSQGTSEGKGLLPSRPSGSSGASLQIHTPAMLCIVIIGLCLQLTSADVMLQRDAIYQNDHTLPKNHTSNNTHSATLANIFQPTRRKKADSTPWNYQGNNVFDQLITY